MIAASGTTPASRERRSNDRRTLHPATLAFLAGCAVLAAVRFTILVLPHAPAGVDGGNWLAQGHSLLGGHPRSEFAYPPVVPLLLTGIVALVGPVYGVGLLAALSSVVPGAAVFAVLRRDGLGWPAAVLGGLVAAVPASGEPAAWGGYPQLLGSGLAILAIWSLDRFARTGLPRHAACAGGLLTVTLLTSHFLAFIAIPAALAVVAWRRRGLALLCVGVPCLAVAPLYWKLTTTLATGFSHRPGVARLTAATLVPWTTTVFGMPLLCWAAPVALTLLNPFVRGGAGPRRPSWVISTALLVAAAAFALATLEPRVLYLMPAVVALALGFWWGEAQMDNALAAIAPAWQRGATSLACVLVAVAAVVGVSRFERQRDAYDILTPAVVEGIGWVRRATPPDAVVAVTDVEQAPLGWWVEGLAHRRTLPGSLPTWLYAPGERARSAQANAIFASGFPEEANVVTAARSGASYLFVAKAWGGYFPARMEPFRIAHPDELVFENAGVVILAVPGAVGAPMP